MAIPSIQIETRLSEIDQEIDQEKKEMQQLEAEKETLLCTADEEEEESYAEPLEIMLVRLKNWICEEDFDELTPHEFNCKVKNFDLQGNELFRLLVTSGFCSPSRAVEILVTLDELSRSCSYVSGALWHFKYDNYTATKLVEARRRKRLLDLMKDEDIFIYNKLRIVLK